MKRLCLSLVFLLFIVSGFISCARHGEKPDKIILFHAGSLTVPFAAMKRDFESRHKGFELQLEASGSQQAARKITDLQKPCDIIASADYNVIDKLLVPRHADWNIRFANNQIVLCYSKKSRYAGVINGKNWHDILQRNDVVWGHSDPNLDPCGYRALMVIQLAEKYYHKPGLYSSVISSLRRENIRPKSVELISMLQTGNMDYAWEYLSVAVQHKMEYVILPDEINLGNSRYNPNYRTAVVRVRGETPGVMMDMKGESCAYGVTLLKNAPNREAAILFLSYMLDPQGGLKIFKDMGQPPFIPCIVAHAEMKRKVPLVLHKFIFVEQ